MLENVKQNVLQIYLQTWCQYAMVPGFLSLYVTFGGRVFQQTIGIPMETNFVPLLVDLFLYSDEVAFIQELFRKKEKKLALSINLPFRYKDYNL